MNWNGSLEEKKALILSVFLFVKDNSDGHAISMFTISKCNIDSSIWLRKVSIWEGA
jgi:hypothetical protein